MVISNIRFSKKRAMTDEQKMADDLAEKVKGIAIAKDEVVLTIQGIMNLEVILKCHKLHTKYSAIEMEWRLEVLLCYRKIIIAAQIDTPNLKRFMVRFVASIYNPKLLYFLKDDFSNPIFTDYVDLFNDLSKGYGIKHIDYIDNRLKSYIVDDIISVSDYFEQKKDAEIIAVVKGYKSWIEFKTDHLGKKATKRNLNGGNKGKKCGCEFCKTDLGVCLAKVASNIRSDHNLTRSIIEVLGVEDVVKVVKSIKYAADVDIEESDRENNLEVENVVDIIDNDIEVMNEMLKDMSVKENNKA